MPNYCNEAYSDVCIEIKKESSAWGKVWSGTWTSGASIMAPGGRDLGRFLTFSNFWAGLVIYSSCQQQPATRIKPYSDVCIEVKKESSAWGKVWSGTWTSRASIMAPGGHDLGSY